MDELRDAPGVDRAKPKRDRELSPVDIPYGRQEIWEDSPEGYPQSEPYKWWNWHDSYGVEQDGKWSDVVDAALGALRG